MEDIGTSAIPPKLRLSSESLSCLISGIRGTPVQPTESTYLPFVSVILAVRNEERSIMQCMKALIDQDYPPDRYEIIIADGASTDRTVQIIEAISARTEPRIVVVPNPQLTVAPGLNAAIARSRGNPIIRMDGHMAAAPDYIRNCVRAMKARRGGVVGGAMIPVGAQPWGKAIGRAMQIRIGVGDARFHTGGEPGEVDTVYLGAFDRATFEAAGLYDESMTRNEDYELNCRIREAGLSVYFDPAIQSTYSPRTSVVAVGRQYFGYGWWRLVTIRRHRWTIRWRQVLPPSLVFLLVALVVASMVRIVSPIIVCTVIASYLAGVFGGVLADGPCDRTTLRTAVCVVCMHWAYGSGFLTNLATAGRWPFRVTPPRIPRVITSTMATVDCEQGGQKSSGSPIPESPAEAT